MQISSRIFWTPKRGNSAQEFEDAFWPPDPLDLRSNLLRFAIADGATESSFARSWAQLLVRAYCRNQLNVKKMRKHLPQLEAEWRLSIGAQQLSWYAEQKLDQGAFATFLGLTLQEGEWQAAAIGDSCLFHTRAGSLLKAFPMDCSGDFNNRPRLLSSNSRNWDDEIVQVSQTGGVWEANDVFYLMTDAAACWFLRAIEQGEPAIERLADAEPFGGQIESLRQTGMRNDDVTVLKITVL
jgi:hypothetical protein